MKVFKGSEIAVGHCGILNDIEAPTARMLVVITEVRNPDDVRCKYLNAATEFTAFNRGGGMSLEIDVFTPVERFGVRVLVDESGTYWCESVGESTATYRDGKPRQWQDRGFRHTARMDLLGLALLLGGDA